MAKTGISKFMWIVVPTYRQLPRSADPGQPAFITSTRRIYHFIDNRWEYFQSGGGGVGIHTIGGAYHDPSTIAQIKTKVSDGSLITTAAGEISGIAQVTDFAAQDVFLMERAASGNAKRRIEAQNMPGNLIPVNKTFVNTAGITAAINIIVMRAPFAMVLQNFYGYRVGGTGATINARHNGVDNHLAVNLSLTLADQYMAAPGVINPTYAAGDKLEVMIITVANNPTQIGFELDFKRVTT